MGGIVLPASPTPAEIRLRLFEVAESAPDSVIQTVITDPNCALTEYDLPALRGVSIRGITDTTLNGSKIPLITRTYELWVLFALRCSGSEADQLAALDVAWAKLDELPDFFQTHAPRLEVSKQAFGGIHKTTRMTDRDGAEWQKWFNQTYSAVTYRIDVTTNR
jgi:hypothetical protein